MESNFNPLGFGYDWIAQTLYIVGRTIQGKLTYGEYSYYIMMVLQE